MDRINVIDSDSYLVCLEINFLINNIKQWPVLFSLN